MRVVGKRYDLPWFEYRFVSTNTAASLSYISEAVAKKLVAALVLDVSGGRRQQMLSSGVVLRR